MNRAKHKTTEALQQDQSEFNVLFVHSELDDYGLTPHEFRLYGHLARRAGTKGAWPSVESMAAKCGMKRDTVFRCLKRLKELNLIRVTERSGYTNLYVLTARSQWKELNEVSPKRGYPPKGDTPHPPDGDDQVSPKGGTRR